MRKASSLLRTRGFVCAVVVTAGLNHAAAQAPYVATGWELPSSSSNGYQGEVATGVGDVDGDGYDDALVTDSAFSGPTPVETDIGRVALYRGGPGGLILSPAWTLVGTATLQELGDPRTTSVGDVNGDGRPDILIGRGATLELWTASGSGFAPTSWSAFSPSTSFVTAHNGVGDVNGDGIDDIVLTAVVGSGTTSTASIEIFLGALGGPSMQPSFVVPGGNGFGDAVAFAGDVNHDGYDDVVYSVEPAGPQLPMGSVGCLFGSATGVAASSWSVAGTQSQEQFGAAVSGVGDVNGDGYDDVLVGAPGYAGGSNGAGRASLFFGSSTGLSPTAAWSYSGSGAGSWLGRAVGSAGDVNGDGYADFLVCFNISNGGPNHIDLFRGGQTGPASVPAWQSPSSPTSFWPRLARVGDFNGDGLSDAVFGDREGAGGSAIEYSGRFPVSSFCAGVGGTACPCGNTGAAGHGCNNSSATGGALLSSTGAARRSADTFVLAATALPPNASVLYFQGTTQVNSGAGAVFGDGLRCAGGTVVRLATRTSVGGASSYPGAGDVPIGVRGMVPASGGVRMYQAWYRDVAAFCTSAPSNTTNGLAVGWLP